MIKKIKNMEVDNIIIPMAGQGLRFKKNNFDTIKPLIKIDHECILEKSIFNLPKSNNKIIILKKNIFDKYSNLRKLIKNNNFKNLSLKKNTLGQADTCYKAKNHVAQDQNLLIHSCDYILRFSKKDFKNLKKNSDVIIFTYRLRSRIVNNYSDYAYCMINNKKIVKKIFEKKIISKKPFNDQMVVGTFWFRHSKIFFHSCEEAKRTKNFVNKELYIANNINLLIKKGFTVKYLEADFWINLGDVHDFNTYIYWQNFFAQNNYLNL